MKMKHTLKLVSGEIKTYIFPTKQESDKALKNTFTINNQFHTIRCIWIEPLNKPWKRERIDFEKLKVNKIKGDGDMTMKAINIDWDVDFEHDVDLPNEINIPKNIINAALDENGEINDEIISDYITNLVGYCHLGFEIEIKENNIKEKLEMKNKKVFVVSVESVRYYESCNTEESINVFESRKDAFEKMQIEIEAAKCDYSGDGYVIEETYFDNGNGFFEIYKDGYWSEDHCRIDLMEKEVK